MLENWTLGYSAVGMAVMLYGCNQRRCRLAIG